MSESKHTPTPYAAEENRVFQVKCNMFRIAICTSNIADYSEEAANAKFIAKACNSHDALLAACRKVQRYKKEAEAGRIDPDTAHDYWESVMSYVDAAIAEAEKP